MGAGGEKEGVAGGGGTQSVRGNYKPFHGAKCDGWLWKGCIRLPCGSCKSYNR